MAIIFKYINKIDTVNVCPPAGIFTLRAFLQKLLFLKHFETNSYRFNGKTFISETKKNNCGEQLQGCTLIYQ